MRRVRGEKRGRLDVEGFRLKLPSLEHTRPGAVRGVGDAAVRLVVVDQVNPAGRRAPERSPAGEHDIEEGSRVVGVGEATREADNGDCGRACGSSTCGSSA